MKYLSSFFRWLLSFIPPRHRPGVPVLPLGARPVSAAAAVAKPKVKVYEPLPGCDWNPLKKFPRNESCYCGSKKKAKKCCLLVEPLAINEEFAEKARPIVNRLRGKA